MTPRNRLPATLLFAALLLFAQGGALLHAYAHHTPHGGHAHHPPGAGQAHDEDPGHRDNPVACELCLAYTPLGGGAAGTFPATLMVASEATRITSSSAGEPQTGRHAYLSRAPPAATL